MNDKFQAAIRLSGLSETTQALLIAVVDRGELSGTAVEIAAEAGISRRSFFRAVNVLVEHGLMLAVGDIGRGMSLRLSPDAEARVRALAVVCMSGEVPGAEYNQLTDVEAARRDRAVYCYRMGRGPRWAMELGERIAKGEA